MVNCNPETVSTDYDTSDRLYFEPLDAEAVLEICARERPAGVAIQFGGQTPLRLARALEAAGYRDPRDALRRGRPRRGPRAVRRALRRARDRRAPLGDGDRARPRPSTAAERIGYPVLVRPSYVLGGRADARLLRGRRTSRPPSSPASACSSTASSRARSSSTWTRSATARTTYVAAVMQHVEEAGVHSGDSSCVLPPISLDARRARAGARASSGGSRRRSASSGS